MEIQKGTLVKVIAGKGKNGYHIVVEEEEEILLLVDGRKRKIENPKRKKRKHVQETNQTFLYTKKTTNREIKQYLFPYNYGKVETSQKKEGEVIPCQNKM